MQITINGKKEIIDNPKSLLELIGEKKLNKEKMVVELNLKIIPRDNLKSTQIQEGDSIEFVSFVGGG
ncbi:MAG: sulfur carrier protein ThiS [Candidatus Omnitrophica bacterium]|nr:sulfur carrier protein ThiS [Candidatus Omnitrophota bacterium]